MILAIGATLIVPGLGQSGDKSQNTLVSPIAMPGTAFPPAAGVVGASWVNGTSRGTTKGDTRCKLQIQMKGLVGLPDSDGIPNTGDEVICLTYAHVNVDPGTVNLLHDTSSVFRGEVRNGTVKIKADLLAEGTGCTPGGSSFPVAQFGFEMTCYEPDPVYAASVECAEVAGMYRPFISDFSQGVCTGPAGGTPFMDAPASPVIATNGIFFAP
jgi:hypothetical protein